MRTALVLTAVCSLAGCLSEPGGVEQPPPNADPQAGCSLTCHGSDTSTAPPMGLAGTSVTTDVGIGAHQRHMDPAPTWHRAVACSDCHAVPAEVGSPGHMDDADRKAEMTFSPIAGAAAAWNGTSCTVNCHGSAAIGGSKSQPTWTLVDGSQAACGSCHGAPPPAPHPTDRECSSCHPTMEAGSMTFRDPASHINGVVDVVAPGATGGCTSCHGSATSSAPPKDLAGNTAPTMPGVGAHQAHLKTSTWHRDIACTSCHVVPLAVDSPGHRDGDNVAEVKFDTLNPAGLYTKATTTCSSNYCHSNGRGNTGTKSWITPGALACGACHSTNGTNMSGDHRRHIVEEGMRCSQCHATVVNQNMAIIDSKLHVNGVHEVKMANGTFNATTRACSNTGCHGTKTW